MVALQAARISGDFGSQSETPVSPRRTLLNLLSGRHQIDQWLQAFLVASDPAGLEGGIARHGGVVTLVTACRDHEAAQAGWNGAPVVVPGQENFCGRPRGQPQTAYLTMRSSAGCTSGYSATSGAGRASIDSERRISASILSRFQYNFACCWTMAASLQSITFTRRLSR